MINPIEQIYELAHNVCYAQGMADVCSSVLKLGLEKIQTQDIVFNHKLDVRGNFVPSYIIEEEARHGYIKGKFDCLKLLQNMKQEDIKEFCETIISIAAQN